jgi:sialic acid synthase SpsE
MAVPVVAITLGDCITEKHFAFSRDMPGPDSVFSLESHEFKAMDEINPNG